MMFVNETITFAHINTKKRIFKPSVHQTTTNTNDISTLNTNKLNKDGTTTMTGNLNMGNKLINFVGYPLVSTEAASGSYVE